MPSESAGLRGLDPCVHCGFCLQACPTFLATGDEADSPRGRIVMMQAMEAGVLAADDPDLATHINRCLGCRACETACPSGVSYGQALETTRHAMRKVRPLRTEGATALVVMAEPSLRNLVLGIARMVRPVARFFVGNSTLGFGMGMLAATRPEDQNAWDVAAAATSKPCDRVAVFRGCIMDGLFDHVNRATVRVLQYNDCEPVDVRGQGCCGALHAHAGLMDEAKTLARRNISAFADVPEATVVINSAGCGSALKEYAQWFRDKPEEGDAIRFSSRVKDVTEVLAEKGPKPGEPLHLKVAYDPPCHLVHAQRIREAPIEVLRAIPGLEIVEHERADECCGSAGIYSLLERRMSRDVLTPKVQALRQAMPDVVVSGNPGCIMQIGAGLRVAGLRDIRVMHPVEILDRSYRMSNGNQ